MFDNWNIMVHVSSLHKTLTRTDTTNTHGSSNNTKVSERTQEANVMTRIYKSKRGKLNVVAKLGREGLSIGKNISSGQVYAIKGPQIKSTHYIKYFHIFRSGKLKGRTV